MTRRRLVLTLCLFALVGALFAPLTTRAQMPLPPLPGASYGIRALWRYSQQEASQNAGKIETGRPGWAGWVGNILLLIIYWLLAIQMSLWGLVLDLVARFFDIILGVTNYASVTFVQEGWRFVRDVLNLVFILTLLAIAFSMIAGLESFQARRLLPRLIFAALLVNFSLAIGGGINGVATCTMNWAVSSLNAGQTGSSTPAALLKNVSGGAAVGPSVSGGAAVGPSVSGGAAVGGSQGVCGGTGRLGTTLVEAMGNSAAIARYFSFGPVPLAKAVLGDLQTFLPKLKAGESPIEVNTKTFDANLAALLGAVAAGFFTLLFIVAIVAFTITFFIRTIIILLLLTLSPLAYALGVVPGLQQYASQWWQQFLKYVIYGPVTMILLVLIVRVLGTKTTGEPAQALLSQLGVNTTAAIAGGTVSALVASAYWTTFVSLYIFMAMIIGQRLGIVGAQAATGVGRRVAGWAARGGPAGPALWKRTVAPFLAARKRAKEELTKERARGAFGKLGTLFGAPPLIAGGARERIRRRVEDEEVKDLKSRSVPLENLTLKKNVAQVRYATQEGLYEAASEDQMKDMLQTLADAGRSGTSEFGKLRTEYLKRLPHTGVADLAAMKVIPQADIADQRKKSVEKLTDLDFVKALRKERTQKVPVNLILEYSITGSNVRAIREHGDKLEWDTLMRERARFTPGAEAEYRRAPGP